MAVTSPIPRLHAVFFSTIVPLVAVSGILTSMFSPRIILTVYNPVAKLPSSIETSTLLDITSTFCLSIIFLQVVLLRLRRHDLNVWKCLQGSILIQDLGILAAVERSLKAQKSFDISLGRAEKWGNVAILRVVRLIQGFFVVGFGLNRVSGG
jgi:hypothetical protein